MASETEVTVRGRLGANPELQVNEGKKPWLRLRVATNKRVRVAEGWEDGPTSWYDVKIWDDFARNVAESLHKGDAVIVQGELRIEEYTNGNGITFRSPVIHAQAFGPDLRGTTARLTRVNRSEPEGETRDLGPVDVSRMTEVEDDVPPLSADPGAAVEDESTRFVAQM
jgi:single-strand DNA-binding protein